MHSVQQLLSRCGCERCAQPLLCVELQRRAVALFICLPGPGSFVHCAGKHAGRPRMLFFFGSCALKPRRIVQGLVLPVLPTRIPSKTATSCEYRLFVMHCKKDERGARRCESPVGYGNPVGIAVVVTIVRGELGGAVLPRVKVPSVRTPVITPSSNEYFVCCGVDNLCKVFLKQDMDLDQAHFTPDSFYVKCVNNVTGATYTSASSRRLSSSQDVQACYGGQYNNARGNTICYSCPEGQAFAAIIFRT